MGTEIEAQLQRYIIHEMARDAPPEHMVGVLRVSLSEAARRLDTHYMPANKQEGTTVSTALLQFDTMLCATMQLGDGEVYAINASTGELFNADIVLYKDDAIRSDGGPPAYELPVPYDKCRVRTHDFNPDTSNNTSSEVMRYNDSLLNTSMSMRALLRSDQAKGEGRHFGRLFGTDVELNEPSREIATLEMYRKGSGHMQHIFQDLQRNAEFVVWQLPHGESLMLVVSCDGFSAKLAFPDVSNVARCLTDPEAYMAQGVQCLDGTILQRFQGRKQSTCPSRVKSK